ncbi:hypothetical protein GCM10022223_53910 [Kineosporia mesophila]|uniref:SnoaL-like domain-containing protein n=1 Tax=Kineosporia mesophila TaxID=566012 RepID=A0ABP7ACY0_9ACTN|nr:MFS transporter [Kineosporia mesophila]MCD5351231.1 MFS transporter [Kineosporia mesophila]
MRQRDFRLLWIGASTSLLGDGVYLVAMAWQALTLGHGAGGLALLGVCATTPQLVCVVFGGVISDRYDRRRILIAADVVRCAAISTVAVTALTGHLHLWHMALLSVVYGAGAGFAAPAFDALLPSLVHESDLEHANALDQLLRPMMLRLLGPALGGALVAAIGAGGAFLVDATSFALSAACVLMIRPRPMDQDDTGAGLLAEAREGLTFIRSRMWLWGTFLSAGVTYLLFIGPTEVLLPYLVRTDFGGSARILGVVLAAGGIGAVGAALLMAQTGLPQRQFTFMYLCWTTATVAVAGYGFATHSWQLALASLLINGFEAAGTIAWATTKQRLVPDALMGRVSSLDWCISIAFLPLSYAITAPVASLLGTRNTLAGAGLLGGAITLGSLFLPQMRLPDGFPAAAYVSTEEEHPMVEASIQPALDALTTSFADRDADAFLSYCAPDITYAGSEIDEHATGQDDVAALLAKVLGRPERYVFTWQRTIVSSSQGDTAWILVTGTGTVHPDHPGPGAAETFPYQLSGVLRREDDDCWRWVLVHGAEPSAGAIDVPQPRVAPDSQAANHSEGGQTIG